MFIVHNMHCLPRYRYQSDEIASVGNKQSRRFCENLHDFALSQCISILYILFSRLQIVSNRKSTFSLLRSETIARGDALLSISTRKKADLMNFTMENRIVNSHRTIETPQSVEFGAELCDELCLIEKKKKMSTKVS